jgi:hypothetical protein
MGAPLTTKKRFTQKMIRKLMKQAEPGAHELDQKLRRLFTPTSNQLQLRLR